LKSYAKAGAVAEEVFTAIKTVFAFNGASNEIKRCIFSITFDYLFLSQVFIFGLESYESKLDDARKYGIKKGIINGVLVGFLWLVIYGAYALGFWYGWKLTTNIDPATGKPEFSVGKILTVFFNIIIAVFNLGSAGPFISTLAISRAAAFEVFKIIDRVI
jgi:hypothetical protein